MLKIFIADDESATRQFIKRILNRNSDKYVVCGEAEDGELALQRIKQIRPDIALIDICMPFLNGLQLIEEIKKFAPDMPLVIITGYDDFEYAKSAVRLQVLDYLLKPIESEEFLRVLGWISQGIDQKEKKKKKISFALQSFNENRDVLLDCFYRNLLEGKYSEEDLKENTSVFGIGIEAQYYLFLFKTTIPDSYSMIKTEGSGELSAFLDNMLVHLPDLKIHFLGEGRSGEIILICSHNSIIKWHQLEQQLKSLIGEWNSTALVSSFSSTQNGLAELSSLYTEQLSILDRKAALSSQTVSAIHFIESCCSDVDLTLDKLSEHLKISSSYISKLLKEETGFSFIQYLTMVRIRNAKELMLNPEFKIYEISELTGYSSQHYFCKAFKKFTGLTPLEYKNRKGLSV